MPWFRVILNTLSTHSQLDFFREIREKYLLLLQVKKLCSTVKIFYSNNNFYKSSQRLSNITVQSVLHAVYFLFELGVAECIRQFKRQHPHIQFDVYLTESTIDLIDAQVDLALRITQKVADGLIARPVCQIESVFCAHPDYLKQHSPLLHPRQLIQHECIAHHSQHQFWTLFDNEQQPQNYPLNVTFKSNDVNALYDMCLHAQGVAMLPSLLVEKDLKEKRLTALFKNFTAPALSLSVVYASRQHLPRITQEFIAFMIENLDFYLKPQN